MKKVLVVAAALLGTAASAQAADLARKAPILKAPPMVVYDWTGFYIGVNGGISVARDRTQLLTTIPSAEQSVLSPFGAIGGGQAGYNWQLNNLWLLGVETDIQASGETTNRTCLLTCTATLSANLTQKIDWFGTTRARVGLVDGPVLTYFTGGVAYGHYSTTVSEPGVAFTSGRTGFGYTYGSGFEAALGGNWTGKIEYLYVDLGKRNDLFAVGAGFQALNTRIHDNIFRAGVNYRFGGTGLVVTPPPANWSGFYLGLTVGSLLGRDPSSIVALGSTEAFHLVPDGYQGGGQLGWNWQASSWVFGLEGDFQGSFSRDKDACVALCNATTSVGIKQTLPWLGWNWQASSWVFGLEGDFQGSWSRDKDACVALCNATTSVGIKQTLPWFGTARGRLGYTLGSTLFYGTGGFAWGQTKTVLSEFSGAGFQSISLTHSKGGWTAGGGIESPLHFFGLFGPNWTAKTEYLYVDLGRTTDNFLTIAGPQSFSTRTTEHIFRGGINYHFNAPTPAVVSSRY